jgi:hypothetical protein
LTNKDVESLAIGVNNFQHTSWLLKVFIWWFLVVYIISYRRNEDHLSHYHFKIKVSSFDALKTLTSENSKHAYFLRSKNYNIEELKRIFTEENSRVIRKKNKSAYKHCLIHQHTSKIVDIVMCLHFKNQTNSSRNSEELQEIVTCKSYFHRKIERGKIRIGKKNSFMNEIKKNIGTQK